MTEQPPLFRELDFTKENVLAWAEERVLDEPVIRVDEEDVANSIEHVLRSVLRDHYTREWSDLDRGELINELLAYVFGGVELPINDMSPSQVLGEIMDVCKESYEFETMDDFVRCFGRED